MPKVSIIIPSYNHSRYLKQRLETIIAQNFKDWEAIIIDDKSTDNSVEIISAFIEQNPNFNIKEFIINEENSGSGYNSWKKGIELATTDYIWIAETDDYADPNFLSESINCLEMSDDLPLVFCSSNYVDQNNTFLYDSRKRTASLKVREDAFGIIANSIIINDFPFSPFITNGSSVVFRKPENAMPEILFQQRQMSDLFLWTWLIQNKDIGFLNKKLNNFRRHPDSTTTKIGLAKDDLIYKEFVQYLSFYPNALKENIFFSKFINHYWIPRLKTGKISLNPLLGLRNYNFFQLRLKFIKHLFRFVILKLRRI